LTQVSHQNKCDHTIDYLNAC